MNWLLALLPSNWTILVLIVLAFGMMFGLVSISAAARILGIFLLFFALEPFISTFMSGLPFWLFSIVAVALAFRVIRGVASLVLGDRVVDHATGALLADALRLTLVLPFRILGFVLRSLFR